MHPCQVFMIQFQKFNHRWKDNSILFHMKATLKKKIFFIDLKGKLHDENVYDFLFKFNKNGLP